MAASRFSSSFSTSLKRFSPKFQSYRLFHHGLSRFTRISSPFLNDKQNSLQFIAKGQVPRRFLNLHEFQSKSLMEKYGIRVQRGREADSPEAAEQIAQMLHNTGAKEIVVKAQVLAGGRGKGTFKPNGFQGGVKVAAEPQKIKEYAAKMIGQHLVTKQTGPEGQLCSKVLVLEALEFSKETKELYVAILMDRTYQGPVVVASTEGGIDIEEVAEKNPEKIHYEAIDIKTGMTKQQAMKVVQKLGITKNAEDAANNIMGLYKMFIESDATQVEINPLVQISNGDVYCVDAKINFDDNAEFRQKELFAQRDWSMEDPREIAAAKYNLNYIGLDGNIACLVNGAGLAMATMDIIKLKGGSPANFLDVGGNANESQVEGAFKILTSDPHVKGILINIFGGIMKCDVIATGVVNAAKAVNLRVPLVVRLEGTNVDKGIEILKHSGINVIPATNLDDAAVKVVQAISA